MTTTLKQIEEQIKSELENFAAESDDCRSVSVSVPDEHPEELWITIEDYGKGARGPHKNPDVAATKQAVRVWLLARGFDIEFECDGDGEVGGLATYQIKPALLDQREIYVSNENCQPIRALYKGYKTGRYGESVEESPDYSLWTRDPSETLAATDSDSPYLRKAAREAAKLMGIELHV